MGHRYRQKKTLPENGFRAYKKNEKYKKRIILLGHKRKPSNFLFKIANKWKV